MENNKKFGTAPVFFTAISTILGAILFLRFGYAVGSIGFWGVILIVLLGHLVTIPTALAISELATNKRVLGGGEYFIISRSFGLNIGATIGFSLFLSQAISVAFYVIAFTEAFQYLFDYVANQYCIVLPRQVVSIPVMLGLAILILKKGANMGVKALYVIIGILFISLVFFFIGKPTADVIPGFGIFNAEFRNSSSFFRIFAIVFPAFTGMTAGVGLSGDLKDPSKSIPRGTIIATVVGMIIYFFVIYKLALSATPDQLLNDQLVMSKIAIFGVIVVPLGLAASTFSSALGSIMVAPRTMQALAMDKSFPSEKINKWIAADHNGEPKNASLVTALIAFVFVALGDVNAVASVISMFFMVTYGSICLISFLNHFGSSPAYRPSFRSKWYLSLVGFVTSVWVMFMIDPMYAIVAFGLIVVLYLYISYINQDRKGLQSIFANAIYQMNRNVQIYLQKSRVKNNHEQEWRPSAICISENTLERNEVFRFLNWISYKYGFGTYIHLIHDYFSFESNINAKKVVHEIIKRFGHIDNHVYIDTIISPSYTSAISQVIQMPGIAGMENNMIVFEYDKYTGKNLPTVIDNFAMVSAGKFDVCILASTGKYLDYHEGIHVWIKSSDTFNSNLMILLSFIILGHPDWQKSSIKIFEICHEDDVDSVSDRLEKMVQTGRLPLTMDNIEIIELDENVSYKKIINERSKDAALTMIGFMEETLKHEKEALFEGYDQVGTILFVNSQDQKEIN